MASIGVVNASSDQLTSTQGQTVDRTDAFREMVLSEQRSLVRLAHALCGDWELAEDCVAEALARVWPKWLHGRVLNIDSYLRRAVVNQVASKLRSRERERRRLIRLGPPSASLCGPADEAADADWIRRAVLALPMPQRQVVVLRYLEDRGEAEIAALLGVPVGTIKSRLNRGLHALAAA